MQTTPILTVSEPWEFLSEDLKDNGHIYKECSNCRALLIDVWSIRPQEKEVWKLCAKCPWCGDKSFVFEIKGGFAYAGISTLREGTEDQYERSTIVDHFEDVNNVIHFHVLKANANAKPVFANSTASHRL